MANETKKTTVTVAKPVMPAATPVAPKTEAKKAPAKKTTAKKATAEKKTEEVKKAPAEKKTEEVKKAPAAKKTSAKKPAAKKPAAKKTTAAKKSTVDSKVYIQFFGKQVTAEDVLASCEADYKSKNKAAVKSIDVYVKPEDNAAYYVVNGDVEGKVSL